MRNSGPDPKRKWAKQKSLWHIFGLILLAWWHTVMLNGATNLLDDQHIGLLGTESNPQQTMQTLESLLWLVAGEAEIGHTNTPTKVSHKLHQTPAAGGGSKLPSLRPFKQPAGDKLPIWSFCTEELRSVGTRHNQAENLHNTCEPIFWREMARKLL